MKAIHGAALALVLAVAGCGDDESASSANGTVSAPPQLTQVEAPNGDWTAVVAETAQGGYLMGNPNAPVKLVEYGSLGCGHCADFSAKGGPVLADTYVKSGQVSWEFRPFLLFPTDIAMTMLMKCQGPQAFFRVVEQLYEQQGELIGKVQNLPQAELQRIQGLPPEQQSAALVRSAGIDQFFKQRGLPESRINSCLADQATMQKLVEVTNNATTKEGVTGTPAFLINGELVPNAASWEALEPALRDAIG